MNLATRGDGILTQFPRFTIIGGCATAVHFLVLVSLMEIGHFPWPTIASAIGSIFGISVSYFGNYSWTFARTEPHKMFVFRFVTTYALSMAAHTGMMFAQIDGLGFHYPLAFVLATILSTLLNFGVAKVAVFERDHYRRHAIFPNRGSSSVS